MYPPYACTCSISMAFVSYCTCYSTIAKLCSMYCTSHICSSQISDVSSYSNAHFGQGSGPILLKNVGCTGSESNLTNCTHDPIGEVGNCTHEDDAGVMCYNCKHILSDIVCHLCIYILYASTFIRKHNNYC